VPLTRRGCAVLVVAVLLVITGVWGHYPLLSTLGVILIGAVLAAVGLTLRGLRIDVRRSVYPDRVERGRPALARLQVSNPGGRRRAGFLATDTAGSVTRTVRVRGLLPGAEAIHHYELPTSVRGRLTIGPLTLHRVDPFELARSRRPTGETATLWVHPRQLPARPLVGGHSRHHHEGSGTDDALRGSVDLQDVREYVPGDEVRHLHWKATARTGRLMVRDLADPQQRRFTVLLDTRTRGLTGDGFEEAVDLTASLLCASARAGQHTRLVTSAGLELPVSGGPQAVRRLLDELSELRQDAAPDAEVVPARLAANRTAGGGLVVVTGGGTGLGSLAWLRSRFPTIFVIALTGPETTATVEVAGARVLRAGDAEEAVRRWNEAIR
jgi:uncharacterized protein (DUF58 family)